MEQRLLNDNDAYNLWVDFGQKMGLESLKNSYGSYWPRKPLEGELVYEWSGGGVIGWSAIRRDVLEPVFWIVVGIFPNEQGKGYSPEIFWSTIKIGFEAFRDVQWCWSAISKKNKKPFSYTRRDTEWIYVGEMVAPEPGYTIFGFRRDQIRSVRP